MEEHAIVELSASELGRRIAARELTSLEATEAYLARIGRLNPTVNAYVLITAGRAREDATRADEELRRGQLRSPLHGVPIALKDLYDTAGITTAGGSKVFQQRVPAIDATTARLLRDAGTVLLGKLNTHEFAAGYTTDNPWFGPTRNPWDLDRIPGGSSGGSGAAIAGRLAAATLGTDTGGSIRVPAAFCGCVGFKPTYGRVSKAGVLPLSFLFDHAGPIVRTVEDAANVLELISGYDAADATTVRVPREAYGPALLLGIEGLRIGLPAYLWELLDDSLRPAIEGAVDQVRALGAKVVEIDLPGIPGGSSAWSTLLTAEVIELHRRDYDRDPAAYSPQLGAWVSSPYPEPARIIEAHRAVMAFTETVRAVLQDVDLLLTPAVPAPPPRIGAGGVAINGEEVEGFSAIGRCMVPFNASRLPALVQPCGFTPSGLPVGLQWAGRPFDEATVLRAAAAYERATDWHRRPSPLSRPQLK